MDYSGLCYLSLTRSWALELSTVVLSELLLIRLGVTWRNILDMLDLIGVLGPLELVPIPSLDLLFDFRGMRRLHDLARRVYLLQM